MIKTEAFKIQCSLRGQVKVSIHWRLSYNIKRKPGTYMLSCRRAFPKAIVLAVFYDTEV